VEYQGVEYQGESLTIWESVASFVAVKTDGCLCLSSQSELEDESQTESGLELGSRSYCWQNEHFADVETRGQKNWQVKW